MHTPRLIASVFGLLLVLALGISPTLAQDAERPAGWTEESHSNDADPNYDVVFPQDSVNSITITIAPDEWQAMLDDMTELYGEFGARQGQGGMGGGPGGERPEGMAPPEGFDPSQMPEGMTPPEGFEPGQRPEGGGMGGGFGMMGIEENPIWVAVDVEMDGEVWTNVGMRFKGNSSLMGAWGSGTYKMGFKLDFDEFEDTYPEIDNQRFYGFKQLSFSSGYSDDSLLREKVTADIFREAGVAAANTAFYAVYVDYGDGPVYFGLYTAVEVIEDTVIDTQFADNDGNVYKPEGEGATFAEGTFSEDSFDKETNEDAADWSDILALFDALHDETRTSDAETWRTNLEAVFDVDNFMHYLAVNTVVQNWDTYGQMAHNFYLYNDPTTGQLTWIPWDNNMALQNGRGGNTQQADSTTSSFSYESVGDNWPLISYLIADPVYHDLYVDYIQDTIDNAFDAEAMEATYNELHALIAPYATAESEDYTLLSSVDAFESSLSELVDHAYERNALAQAYVDSQTAE